MLTGPGGSPGPFSSHGVARRLLRHRRHALLNARLDDDRASKLEYLRRTTGRAVSEIVKRGIDLAYEEARRTPGSPHEILTASGFVGSGEGPEDLSVRYKGELLDLAAKHGDR
jgi:hypothetical protein